MTKAWTRESISNVGSKSEAPVKLTGAWGVDPAQAAATRECQHPQQSRVLPHEPFEPHGMN